MPPVVGASDALIAPKLFSYFSMFSLSAARMRLACPGETMTVLAARVGGKSRALHRPMMHLKATGRVRSAGERNFTRYFPMAAAKAA